MRARKCKHQAVKTQTTMDYGDPIGSMIRFNEHGWYCQWCKIPLKAVWKSKPVYGVSNES